MELPEAQFSDDLRSHSMNAVNPKFILRNYLLEEAIKHAEREDDFSKVDELLKASRTPFDNTLVPDDLSKLPPSWAYDLCVSCSS